VGLKRFVKRVARKSWDANKYIFGGGAVKDVIKKGVSTVQKVASKNPELASAALTVAGATTGFGDLAGILGGFGGFGGTAPPPPPPPPEPDVELEPGFDPKTVLLAGGALVALVALSRRK
jgi:hypothetical protein